VGRSGIPALAARITADWFENRQKLYGGEFLYTETVIKECRAWALGAITGTELTGRRSTGYTSEAAICG
jgi:hypothetical protein